MKKLLSWFLIPLNNSKQGVKDVFISMVPQAISLISGLITSILIARGLGPKGMGSYALVLSISGLAAGFSDLGISQTAIRYASLAISNFDKISQLSILRWAFRLRILLSFTISLVAFIFTPFIAKNIWHDSSLIHIVRLSLLTGIFTTISAVPSIYFLSMKKFKMNAIVSIGQTMVSFLSILLINYLNKWSLDIIIIVSIIATGIGAILFITIVPFSSIIDLEEIRGKINIKFITLFKNPTKNDYTISQLDSTAANTFASFMLISSIVVTITVRADVWLMGIFLNKSQIGLYSVVSRYTLPLIILLSALNTALWPRASAITDISTTSEIIYKTLKLSLLLAFVGIFYSFLAPLTTPLIYGSKYKDGILLGQVLCFRYCLAILICPIGVIGYSFGLVRVFWWINILQSISVITINIILLPKIGAMGSALALIANEIIGFIFTAYFVWHRLLILKTKENYGNQYSN